MKSNVAKMKTKRLLLKIGKIVLIILAILLALIIIGVIIGNLAGKDSGSANDTLISSRSSALSEELQEAWGKTPSDIEGMTKLDKYNAGLSVAAGSDSDGDGLTDKEEIELYHSDPLKVSTAGDLYSDLYKVENGLDISTAYEYMGDRQFSYNNCPEVSLSAETPLDFNAVVTELPGIQRISGLQVYSAYQVYNYSGKFSVDLTDVLRRENIKLSDVAVYVSDGNSLESYSYTDEGNTITLKDKFSPSSTYQVYCTEKNFIRFAAAKLGADNALDTISAIVDTEEGPEEVTGAGLVIVSPLFVSFKLSPMVIYHEKLSTEADTQILKDKITNHILDYFGIENEYRMRYKESNAIEIELTYNLLKSALSFLDVTNMAHSQLNSWKYIFFIYYDYEGKLAFERRPNTDIVTPPSELEGMTGNVDSEGNIRPSLTDPVTGFDLFDHTLPFGNFKTAYSPDGSCAGISHLTAYLYNQGTFPSRSNAAFFKSDVKWDLGSDEENYTLLEPGLADFKDENFVQAHSSDGQTLDTDLTKGEMEFAKMVASAYLAGNKNAEFIFYELFGGNNVVQDYSVIESAIAYLESGKILDVYLDMVDGTRHTVNLIGYKQDAQNPDVVWFSVYDCNFPGNRTEEPLSDTGFQLRVEKKLCTSGKGYTFGFDYFPLQDRSYGASSNPNISKNNLIIILDEFGHLLND